MHVKLDVQRVTFKKSERRWCDEGTHKGWVCTHMEMFDVFRLPAEFANIRTLTPTSSKFFDRRFFNITKGSQIMIPEEKQCLKPRQLPFGSACRFEEDDVLNCNPSKRSMQRFKKSWKRRIFLCISSASFCRGGFLVGFHKFAADFATCRRLWKQLEEVTASPFCVRF